jgi:hypothetical protein
VVSEKQEQLVACLPLTTILLLPSESLAVLSVPGIAAQVIAALFPETRLVRLKEVNAPDPLGGFPGVELRDYQADGAAVIWWDWLAVVRPREE